MLSIPSILAGSVTGAMVGMGVGVGVKPDVEVGAIVGDATLATGVGVTGGDACVTRVVATRYANVATSRLATNTPTPATRNLLLGLFGDCISHPLCFHYLNTNSPKILFIYYFTRA